MRATASLAFFASSAASHVAFDPQPTITGTLVKVAEARGLDLHEIDDAGLAEISPHLVPEVREVLTIQGSVTRRDGQAGTAPVRVAEQRAALVARVHSLASALVR